MLCAHYVQSRALNCFSITLGIFDEANGRWLDHTSPPTSCAVGVYNYLSGDAPENLRTLPVRYNFTHQGNTMILRGSRFKHQTVPPPPGFNAYKCVSGSTQKEARF